MESSERMQGFIAGLRALETQYGATIRAVQNTKTMTDQNGQSVVIIEVIQSVVLIDGWTPPEGDDAPVG